jgi:hypothetical protein
VLVQDLELGTTESRIVPLVIRMPVRSDLPRTIPIAVEVVAPTGALRLDATFKTGGQLVTP